MYVKIDQVLRQDVLSLVGNTPMVSLSTLSQNFRHITIYAKLEWYNPGGSVKDRPALRMILDGEEKVALTKDKIIIDATSGNTGIAYSLIGAVRGYRVLIVMPENASSERKRIIRSLGADIVFTNPLEGTDGAQKEVKRIIRNNPEKYFYPDQYNNEANWRSHYDTTAEEIIRQTNSDVTHFVTGLGTTGTFVGVARKLKEYNSKIKCIGVMPDSPLHGIEGLKHLPTSLKPGIFNKDLADEIIEIPTEVAYKFVKRLALKEGLMVGVSSGAALAAAVELAKRLKNVNRTGENYSIVAIFPDSADKYLSERFWNE